MSNHLSILGIIHTAISIFALLAAFYALFVDGRIDPKSQAGKIYIILTVITCLTSFPIMKTGHPTPGHAIAVMVLLLLLVANYTAGLFKSAFAYVQTAAMSATLFLSMIPAVNETLTRLPASHPFAASPDAPLVKMGVMVVFLLFVVGVIYQIIKIRSYRKMFPYHQELSM